MKVYLDTIGCRLNQSEIEKIALEFRALGHVITANVGDADLVVVNTCAVTGKAVADSRRSIRRLQRESHAKIAVTGCWATLEPARVSQMIGVEWVVSNCDKEIISQKILEADAIGEMDSLPRKPIPGSHFRTRAFIKIQDGCDNHCIFCVTRIARGASRSRPIDGIFADIQSALDGGSQEIVLTGVNLGSWGHDFYHPHRLQSLVEDILARTSVPRLRLSSIEPWDLHPEFFALWKESRMCRQLHIPLQSGSDAVLKRMGRKIDRSTFLDIVRQARAVSPAIAITTDMIVGFPGESQHDFEESLEFVRHVGFSAGHVFIFSPRPGTPAYQLPGRAPRDVCKQRSIALRGAFSEMNHTYREQWIGGTLNVLWETVRSDGDGRYIHGGHSDNYLKVEAVLEEDHWNEVHPVLITGLGENGLIGERPV